MIAKNRHGMSLVELLVVIVIISILSALVLPSFKNVLSERKTNVAALEVKSFLEAARARAIARGRNVSVILERLSSRGDGFGINPINIISEANPPRSITAENPIGGVVRRNAVFGASDAFLNYSQYNTCIRMTMAETLRPTEFVIPSNLQAVHVNGNVTIGDIPGGSPPEILDKRFATNLVSGNEVELVQSSGVASRFRIINTPSQPPGDRLSYSFDIDNLGSENQPFGTIGQINLAAVNQRSIRRFVNIGSISSIRVYSQPYPLASVTNELPRGTCVDLSISGLSSDEPLANYTSSEFTNCQREFASDWIMPPGRGGPPTPQQLRPVTITFSPSGNIDSVISNGPQLFNFNPPTIPRELNSHRIEPNQDIFLFVGRTDQVVLPLDTTVSPVALNALGIAQRVDEGAKPNMLDPTGYWVRISATNGSVSAAPTQAWHVEQDVAEARSNPSGADALGEMLTESRALTFQSELSSQ